MKLLEFCQSVASREEHSINKNGTYRLNTHFAHRTAMSAADPSPHQRT